MMIEVDELFPDTSCRTRVWLAPAAVDALVHYETKKERHRGAFQKKLKRYAVNGFALFQGKDKPIRPEWDGIFRIGDSSLFRLIGFFDDGTNFIVVDGYLKHGQKLTASERTRIHAAADVKKRKLWKRRWISGHNRRTS